MRLISKLRYSPWYFQLSLLRHPSARRDRNKGLEIYRRLGIERQLAFDIGASNGGRTELLLHLKCRVVALEPDPAAFEILNCRFGKTPGAVLLQEGAGSRSELKTLYRCETSSLSTFSDEDMQQCLQDRRFSSTARQYRPGRQVQITTLDRLIDRFGLPYFCKISTIGYEKHILTGLHHPVPVISFALNLPYQVEAGRECGERIASLGDYRFGFIFSTLTNGFDERGWMDPDRLQHSLGALNENRPGNSSYLEVYCVASPVLHQLHLPLAGA